MSPDTAFLLSLLVIGLTAAWIAHLDERCCRHCGAPLSECHCEYNLD